jgi:glycerol kinase
MDDFILSIDQGTTSTRAIIFDKSGTRRAVHQIPLKQFYPQDGWVEHDAEEIWKATLECCNEVIPQAGLTPDKISAIGISNQRETTIVWDKNTGRPVHNALVWQGRHSAQICHELLKDEKLTKTIEDKTGLVIDPYFSATKIKWLLDKEPDLRPFAEDGSLLFGTVDTFLLWKLTGGKVHATDMTNASRTLLYNIYTHAWDDELLSIFSIPKPMLPEVKDSNAKFGVTNTELFGTEIPITGIAGDQQAAMIGQVCFNKGMIKSTYGTGCFLMLNTGKEPVKSTQKLLTTIAYSINGEVTYALEGSIFVAGAAIQWLRDALHLFQNSSDTEELAKNIDHTHGVYLVPAFTGLGAPYWDSMARGAILGLTRDTSISDIVRAALEAVCYQTNDLLTAVRVDYKEPLDCLRVDGGMTANDWLIQFLSDVLNISVQRPEYVETSALGAAYIAGLGAGIYKSLDDIVSNWHVDQVCQPTMEADTRQQLLNGWTTAVKRVMSN